MYKNTVGTVELVLSAVLAVFAQIFNTIAFPQVSQLFIMMLGEY